MINEKWNEPGSGNFQRIPGQISHENNTPRESALHLIGVIDDIKEHLGLYWALIKLIEAQDKKNNQRIRSKR